MEKRKSILILAPHTDDGELGCGGAISKYLSQGHSVYYAAFSLCRRHPPKGMPPDTLEKEVKRATSVLGIPKKNLILFDFDARLFKKFRQEILDALLSIKRRVNPDLVFAPSPTDIHQDHQVISEEAIRAYKDASILGYEMPWNNLSFNTRCFIKINEKQIAAKIRALREYHSQKNRPYFDEKFIKALAITRGVQIGSRYAEAFEIIRLIME